MTETAFDLQKAERLAHDYARATGTECLVLSEDDTISSPCQTLHKSGLCFEHSGEIARCCITTHKNGALKSGAGGQTLSYYCPMGLLHWAAPIVVDGVVRGAFIGGHAFLNKAKANIADLARLTNEHRALLEEYPALKESLLASPVISEERLESLKTLLGLVARTVSDGDFGSTSEPLPMLEEHTEIEPQERPAVWQQLLAAIEKGDMLRIDKHLQKCADSLPDSTRSLDEDKALLTEVVLTVCERFLDDDGQPYLRNHCLNDLNDLSNIHTHEALARFMTARIRNQLEQARLLPTIRNADMIYDALTYIEAHFAERMTLQDIADHVHFSAPYFSKIFKREMAMTFVQYLTRVRIDEGKRLLAETAIPLGEIPARVGFEEQSYFTKVFRATVGVSPGRYRDQTRALQSE